MSYLSYSNHFYTNVYTSGLGATLVRSEDNPCYGIALSDHVPSKYKRLQLFVQNQGTTEVDVTFGDEGNLPLKLYAGQSIAFENYNGPLSVSESTSILVFETFA